MTTTSKRIARLAIAQESTTPPSSCGLDFWHSRDGTNWVCAFLKARPALICVEEGERQASLYCLLRQLPGGFLLALAYPYGVITGDAELFWSAGAEIQHVLSAHRIARLEIPFTGEYASQLPVPPPPHSRAFMSNMRVAVRHIFDFSSPHAHEDIESRLHPNIRWAIRKAARNGCQIRAAAIGDIDAIQALYVETMRAKRAPVNYGPERWSGLLNGLAQKGIARVLLGEIDGKPVGVAAMVDGALSRHFIQLAVPPRFQASRIGELLVVTGLREAANAGKHWFDFMASPVRDKGLIAFKAKWGSREEVIQHIVIPGMPFLAPLVDLGRWLNRMGARLRGQ